MIEPTYTFLSVKASFNCLVVPNCFELHDLDQGKSILLCFPSLDLKEEWSLILRDMVKDYQKQRALRQMAITKQQEEKIQSKPPVQKKASVTALPLHRLSSSPIPEKGFLEPILSF